MPKGGRVVAITVATIDCVWEQKCSNSVDLIAIRTLDTPGNPE